MDIGAEKFLGGVHGAVKRCVRCPSASWTDELVNARVHGGCKPRPTKATRRLWGPMPSSVILQLIDDMLRQQNLSLSNHSVVNYASTNTNF